MLKRLMVPVLLFCLTVPATAQDAGAGTASGAAHSGVGTSSGSGASDGSAAGSTGTSNGSSGVGGSATDTPTESLNSGQPCSPNKSSNPSRANDQKRQDGASRIGSCD